ncbi:glutathione S-transferase C-terminal domain-containing protein [Actinoplanes sp. RD1]|uniref:glutathione S-transferase C-terminal domain-containing protein n=1 Tax=Actinoplanes sp. RD1 TaxID=3064538 RepID=UPI0027426549|nr:glutathione S-transferase C-terminal domain-containing protein [Actinoplanes sp. RD1]
MSAFASPVDVVTYGEYVPGDVVTFPGRVTEAAAGRYHLYGGWFCPWWHRVAITRALSGLDDVVTMSFVDGERDSRGWAFREQYGPDPVNGFTLLRQAYEATQPGFRGHVSVPALWDRATSRLVSNDPKAIGLDFATAFRGVATPLIDTYPEDLRAGIEELDSWIGPAVNRGTGPARTSGVARETLLEAFERLDSRLSASRYLLGDRLTEADIRLWVTLVRYDVGANAHREINAGLHVYPHLWAYARDLYTLPAFHETTDFAAFSAPDVDLPDWSAPADR